MGNSLINNVSITIATVNGTGSASANGVLFKTLFKMGLPCSAKNYFPSNIQGMATWFQIRVSAKGYLCRKDKTDIMVAFNPASMARDVKRVRPGGVFLYDNSTPLDENLRNPSLHYVGVAATRLVHEQIKVPQLRTKLSNMVYVGALARMLAIPLDIVEEVLTEMFGKKAMVVESNKVCVELGYNHVEIPERDIPDLPRLQAIPGGNTGKMMTDGNNAAALGALFGGVSMVAWYPITPSTSVVESLMAQIGPHRKDEQGKNRYAIVQTEDELASVSMIVGAGWAGARAMTATSGPGLSLMQEGIGLAYFTETPCVVFNVSRAGPSTGLPTRTQQSDISLLHQGSHGDTKHLVLIPHDNPSAFEMGWRAFDAADVFQTPVFVMLDLDLGMNDSISSEFEYPDEPMNRGRLLTDDQLAAQGNVFHRYADAEHDGIPQRTIPGMTNPGAAYFTRGSGHDEDARYTEDAVTYQRQLDRLLVKYQTARTRLPQPIVDSAGEAPLGLISFGTSVEPTREARDILAAQGVPTHHLLLRALPLSPAVEAFIQAHPRVVVVEQNRDGQMTQIIRDDYPHLAPRVRSAKVYYGLPPTAAEIARQVTELEKNS